VSADGRRLLLVDARGTEFTLDVTSDLRAALRGETARIGQLEIQMTSTLRPREIQSRIRSGETAEGVAQAAGTTVEAIMPFVAPVLAEREHVAERAQKSSLRRTTGDGARSLGEAVAAQVRSADAKPETVSWDAYRRDDGRWVLTATFTTPARSGTAAFTYDPPGNYVLADDDDARWLVGDLAPAPAAPPNDLEQARLRRMAATTGTADELPLGEDAIDLVSGEATGSDALVEDPGLHPPTSPSSTVEPSSAELDPRPEDDDRPHRRSVQKRRGRASVPSWDEIMFGGGDQ